MPVNCFHALVLDRSGTHYFTCGYNESGQLGTGDQEDQRETFTQVNLPEKFLAISAGYRHHSLGISESDGALWFWGASAHHQSGLSFHVHPTKIPGTHSFVQISAGSQFSLALDSNGHVWSFESEATYVNFGAVVQLTPSRMEGFLSEIKFISAGMGYALFLDDVGSVWSFGNNETGQLGLGDANDRSTPCKIQGIPQIVQISSGFYHNLMLDSLGCVWSVGCNAWGALGLPDTRTRSIPEMIPNMKDIFQVFCCGYSSILKNKEQQVFVFGSNECSQLGMENKANIFSPVEQELWRGKTIIPGGCHNVILDEEGYLYFFGDPPFVYKGKHEGVQIEQQKKVPTKNARNIISQ